MEAPDVVDRVFERAHDVGRHMPRSIRKLRFLRANAHVGRGDAVVQPRTAQQRVVALELNRIDDGLHTREEGRRVDSAALEQRGGIGRLTQIVKTHLTHSHGSMGVGD